MKMREALVEISKIADDWQSHANTKASALDRIYELANTALAAPPRNCDRFADEIDAQIAFLNEVWLISVDRETMLELDKYENWTDEMRKRYGRWLLAPAERKGADVLYYATNEIWKGNGEK